MLNPDYSDRTYTAEVIKCKTPTHNVANAILRLTSDADFDERINQVGASATRLRHSFLPTKESYHRFPREVTLADGSRITIPRQKESRTGSVNLYDVLIAESGHHVIVAVPFHELAEEFFVRVHERLSGMNARYEKLDITEMVIRLAQAGAQRVLSERPGVKVGLSITRCHIVYSAPDRRTLDLQQVTMTGANLGASKDYQSLIQPLLRPKETSTAVTPNVLGFALLENGVRKSSATTDQHGNFKIWIAPGLRRLIRVFALLETLEGMKDIALTTPNVPILQSATIQHAEERT
jgi:hypothetical protein